MSKKFPTWEELGLLRRTRCLLEFSGLWLATKIVPLLPAAVLRGVARLAGRLVCRFDKRGRSYAEANLRMVFGNRLTDGEIRAIAEGSYAQFARTMLELFWVPNIRRDNYRSRIELVGYDRAREVCRASGGVIGICLHYGNFEWLSLLSGYEITQGVIVTQKFRNPLIGPVFDRLRASGGHRIIQQERSILSTLRHLKNGGSVGILVDLQLDPRLPSTPVRTFGRWCPMTKMHAVLHKRTGCPIVPMESIPLPDGRYRQVMHEPMSFPPEVTEQEIVQRCWDVLEPGILRQPAAWLWPYKHWRFVPEGEDPARYPFYASQEKAFDDLMAAEIPGHGTKRTAGE